MYKRKSATKKEIIFPMKKNYDLHIDRAIKLAQEIGAIEEKERKNSVQQCLTLQNN